MGGGRFCLAARWAFADDAAGGRLVEFRFNADEWERLTPAERVRRCGLLATEAQTLASLSTSTSYAKSLYLGLALHWKLLAEEIALKSKTAP